jgi:tetratricopeptide (TPR) repeat protein
MPISKSDELFALVKSLTKAEKRNFKIYAQRMSDAEDLLFLQLFEILDKQKELNEAQLHKRFDKSQLPNLKRHLYSQILVSLKLLFSRKRIPIQIREFLDFANILYGKGLYKQSLKILDKATTLAEKLQDDVLILHILEHKKIIESRHITRTGTHNVVDLTMHTSELLSRIDTNLKLSNLRLILHGWYIRRGHVKSAEEASEVLEAYNAIKPEVNLDEMGIVEKAYHLQSRVWLNFMLCDFQKTFTYAKMWVELFKNEKGYINRDMNLLMRGYHYILTSLYNLGDLERYTQYLKELEAYRKDNYKKFNKNSQVISFLYTYIMVG